MASADKREGKSPSPVVAHGRCWPAGGLHRGQHTQHTAQGRSKGRSPSSRNSPASDDEVLTDSGGAPLADQVREGIRSRLLEVRRWPPLGARARARAPGTVALGGPRWSCWYCSPGGSGLLLVVGAVRAVRAVRALRVDVQRGLAPTGGGRAAAQVLLYVL